MEQIKYSGKIIEVIESTHPHHGNRVLEIARRSPGVRALVVHDNKILLTKEFRHETNNFQYRLPGGKVFDTLAEFKRARDSDMHKFAVTAVIKEVSEEVGLNIKNPKLIKISCAGATIKWDLFYFEITEFEKNPHGQHLEDGEDITFAWFSFPEVIKLCKDNKIDEDRSVGVLLTYLHNFHAIIVHYGGRFLDRSGRNFHCPIRNARRYAGNSRHRARIRCHPDANIRDTRCRRPRYALAHSGRQILPTLHPRRPT
ncbi:MAG: NUDIX domain-containing protein [Firmicutes bacterium]|nr:NUDIX domain-containing protein [Bacillota bacterium]